MRRTTKILFFLFLILLLLGEFFGFGEDICWAEENDLIITEIMYNPDGSDTGREWIEIYNKNGLEIDLLGWKFFEASVNHGLLLFKGTLILKPGDYAVITENAEKFLNEYPTFSGNLFDSSFSLNNDGESLALKDTGGKLVAQTSYSNTAGGNGNGFSIELEDNLWRQSYIFLGTPGLKNSEAPPPPPPIVYSDKIIFNEILPNPSGTDSNNEFMEFYNSGNTEENLENWKLKDKDGTIHLLKKIDGISLIIKPQDYLVINPNKYGVSLHNGVNEQIFLLDPKEKEISVVSYKHDDVKEGVSYNFDGTTWRWSQFLTPEEKNIFNNEPYGTTKIDKDVFINVYADFFVSTNDSDGEKVSVVWDFGDGHKSYLQKTRHKYTDKGLYHGTIKLSDGSEDVLKNFTVEVKKYPEPKIKIVKIKANPKGKDAEGEEIYFKNTSKKKMNLKTWSIATGSKTLVNHPITKDFSIKPGKTKKITRKYSLFTLNNKKGVIELRYPNGEVASRVKYDKKKESVKDDEVYELSGKDWRWNAPPEEALTEETTSAENLGEINLETESEISNEEISLNLGKYSSENKLASIEAGFMPNAKNLLQSREAPGIVLGAFSARDEIRKPLEIKSTGFWQKTLQRGNQIFNLLINKIMSLI